MATATLIKPKRSRKRKSSSNIVKTKPKAATKEKPAKKKSTGNSRAIKKEVDGFLFDSTMEANYYEHLKAEQAAGRVLRFTLQPKFILLEPFKKNGKTTRGIMYISDFWIYYADGSDIVVDVKGRETPDFKLKRKLFDALYPEHTLQLVIWDTKNNVWEDFDVHKKAMAKAKRERNKGQKKIKGGPSTT